MVLQEDEERARAAIERTFETAGLAVPAMAEALAKSGVETRRARTLLEILVRQKRLLRITEELVFHRQRHRAIAPDPFGAAVAEFRGRGVQGMDGDLAEICHSAARIPGP